MRLSTSIGAALNEPRFKNTEEILEAAAKCRKV